MPRTTASATRLPSSGIREIVDLALASPAGLVRMEIGEPDFTTPSHIVEAAFESARRGSAYVQSSGMPVLREAVLERLTRVYGLGGSLEQVVITQGAVQAIAAIMSAVVGAGDEVLVPDPAWPNYEMQATLLGATTVRYPLRAEAGFQPDPDYVESLVTERTKVLVLNSPNNPTGSVMPASTVQALVEIAVRHDILVISDEVYDEIIFDGQPAGAARYAPENVAAVYSFSKTYAMTGWRVGYALVPRWLATSVSRVLETTLSCVSSVTQGAALAAITGPSDVVAMMRDAYRARRDTAMTMLEAAGLDVVRPSGAFYLMVPLEPGADARMSALDLVRSGVSFAPGTAFGDEAVHHLRVSLATSFEGVEVGLARYIEWHRVTGGGVDLEASAAQRAAVGPTTSGR